MPILDSNVLHPEKVRLLKPLKRRLKRSLKPRHLQMIAIGGTIGTGLFIGSGATIAMAGPLGSLLAFTIVSVMVFCIVTSLGEMATFLPISGSFVTYASRFVDPALAYSLGWNYWLQWAISLPSELSAVSIIMGFWSPAPSWVWTFSILLLLFIVNAIGVGSFGEIEYWLASVKVVAVIIFIIVGIIVDLGGFGDPAIGFDYYRIPESPFKNGIGGIINVFLIAFYAFGGTELVGITVGEVKNPKVNVPRAIYGTFYRILIFYIASIFVMGLVIRHDDPKLLLGSAPGHSVDMTVSPFTLVFDRISINGSKIIAHIMNGVILSAVLSAGNSAMYASSRTMHAMAAEGRAPHIFSKLNSRGIPIYSLCLTTAIGCLSFLGASFGNGVVFQWLLSLTGVSGVMTWISIAVIHLRFRKALVLQGKLDQLPYKSPYFPWCDWIGIGFGTGIVLAEGYAAASLTPFKLENILAVYIGIPFFFGIGIYYKIRNSTQITNPEEADLQTGNIWGRNENGDENDDEENFADYDADIEEEGEGYQAF